MSASRLAARREAAPARTALGLRARSHAAARPDPLRGAAPKKGCACGGGCPRCRNEYPLQAMLEVSQPGDALEQEADRVAEQVLSMPQPEHPDEPEARESTALSLSRYASGSSAESSPEVPSIVHDVVRSPGEPLDAATRAFMEPRFGADFGAVRVHTDDRAQGLSVDLYAHAFTLGNDIFFAADKWSPGTTAGRRLIAHELAHVMQQSRGGLGIQRNGPASAGTSPTAPGTTAAGATSAGSGASADPCAEGIAEMRTGALDWLDKAYEELLEFDVTENFPPPAGGPADPDQERRGRVLLRTFRTRDLGYVEVIRRRLLQMASSLRAGDVSITCAAPRDPNCSVSGSSFIAAYVEHPFALVMCSVGLAGHRPVQTFVHELAHAVVPKVGITMKRGDAGRRVTDRAYEHERLFRYMTPEEALDNAESYGLLVEQLATGVDAEVATSPLDAAPGCKDPGAVVASIARFEQWTRDADRWLQAAIQFLTPSGGTRAFTDLPEDERDKLVRHFPGVSSVSGLKDMAEFYQRMNYALSVSVEVACAKTGGNCSGSTLGYAPTGSVTASAPTLGKKATEDINLCPRWFDAAGDERVASLYALFILSRPGWMTKAIKLGDVFSYAKLAGEIHGEITPAPTTSTASEHLSTGHGP